MAGKPNRVTVDITTGVGTISFPKVFESTKATKKKDDGTEVDSYEIQILIPKTDREACEALIKAYAKVAKAEWGDNWKEVGSPIRDGDKEAKLLTSDGQSKRGDKYPERAGHIFINARSQRPIAVVDKTNTPITKPTEMYGGCKGRISVTFYPYNQKGNIGVAAALNGVQKIADGEPFGGGAPAVDTMFDLLEDADDDMFDGLGGDEPKGKKSKKSKAKAKVEPEPEPEPEVKKAKKNKKNKA